MRKTPESPDTQPDHTWLLAMLRMFVKESLDKLSEFETMGDMGINTEPTSQAAPRIPMFSEDWGERKAIFYETFQSVKNLVDEWGVKIYQVSAADFFRPILEGITENNQEALTNIFDGAAIVCQLGVDRSKKLKLLALGLGAQPAITSEDDERIERRLRGLEVGMSWADFGKLISEGTVNEEGHLIPKGYDRPVTKIIGFLDKAGVRKMEEVDMEMVNIMSKRLVHLLREKGIKDLDLEITIVEGTSALVDDQIDRVMKARDEAS